MTKNNPLNAEEIDALAVEAVRMGQLSRDQDAVRLWSQVLHAEPNHLTALTALGQRAFRAGDLPAAHAAFKRLVVINGSDLLTITNNIWLPLSDWNHFRRISSNHQHSL